ncbi:hypothetical protein KCM76_25020 [Zooshikella marina]|uniref:hypothetical protein n=1 Tax=Zooshikella ganghwensis TaxID=202772 RepID=UPI001BB0CBA3|nr:hypothetical protein [Zooshikella ganghwensis]MBU2709282.1 hypothetical protein [Zooshikella ganghwensis]
MNAQEIIFEIVKSVFPSNAEIKERNNSLLIDWTLNNDPGRPNQRSKTIILEISQELLEDLPNESQAKQEQCFGQISTFLQQELANFEPNHNTLYGQETPSERWVITTQIAGLGINADT